MPSLCVEDIQSDSLRTHSYVLLSIRLPEVSGNGEELWGEFGFGDSQRQCKGPVPGVDATEGRKGVGR